MTAAVKTLPLPRGKARVRPGQVCSVAGWGQIEAKTRRYPDTLQEVSLEVQKDSECEFLLPKYYDSTTQLCVGNPKETKSSFQVRLSVCLAWLWGQGCLGRTWDLEI